MFMNMNWGLLMLQQKKLHIGDVIGVGKRLPPKLIGDVIGVGKRLPPKLLIPVWELRQIRHPHILMGLVNLATIMAGCLKEEYHLMYPSTKFYTARSVKRLTKKLKQPAAEAVLLKRAVPEIKAVTIIGLLRIS